MSELLMPPYPNGSVQQQLTQQYSYLFQMAQQLNMALAALEGGTVSASGGSGPQRKGGVAVGQNLTTTEIDGKQVVEQNNFRAVFTAQKLSFWQDSTEIAYVSNNRLYITSITVLDSISIGSWRMESGSGLTFKWIGG